VTAQPSRDTPVYDVEFSGEIDSEFVVDYYKYTSKYPLSDTTPEQEVAEQFNITAEQVLEIVTDWNEDRK
jgi:hypothetical protein